MICREDPVSSKCAETLGKITWPGHNFSSSGNNFPNPADAFVGTNAATPFTSVMDYLVIPDSVVSACKDPDTSECLEVMQALWLHQLDKRVGLSHMEIDCPALHEAQNSLREITFEALRKLYPGTEASPPFPEGR